MILALFGTNPYPFERLVGFLERLAEECDHEIVAQTGTSCAPQGCRAFAYASYQDIQNLMSKADFVVAQGGYGSCLDALTLGRPIILVPRLRESGECLDDQVELAKHFATVTHAQCVETYPELRAAINFVTENSPAQTEARKQPLGKEVAQEILQYLEL